MGDIPAGWLALITLVSTGALGGVGWVFKALLNSKDTQIARLEAETAANRLKIAELQDKALVNLQEQIANERKRTETDQRVARSMEEQTALIKGLVRT